MKVALHRFGGKRHMCSEGFQRIHLKYRAGIKNAGSRGTETSNLMNIVFFIRAYNDIDFMAPVAYKLLATGTVDKIHFVNQDLDRRYHDDFRIRYLKQFGQTVMTDMVDYVGQPLPARLNERYGEALRSFKPTAVVFNKLVLARKADAQQFALKTFDLESLPLTPGEPTVFLFDYNRSMFAYKAWKYANDRGIPIAMMSHGLRTIEASGLLQHWKEEGTLECQNEFSAADYLFTNNENFTKTLHGVPREKFIQVGASRFASEWSEVLDEITPAATLPDPGPDVLRVCIMPSKFQHDVWERASLWILSYLASRDDVYTIVKPHTRGMDLESAVQGASNVVLADEQTDSRRLIQWADVTFFWKSSIFVDALLLDKPLLHVRYASSCRLACDHLVEGWNLDSHLDVIDWIDRLSQDRSTRTYTPEERKDCLDFYVDDGNGDVLDRHVEAIVKMASGAAKW